MKFSKCLLAAAVGFSTADATGMGSRGNPIRKVVTMLQNIAKKVEDEGKAAEDLFDKFMCECNTQSKQITKQIESAETKGSDVAAGLEAGASQATQLAQDIKQAKKDRAAAKEAIAAATGIREKELAEFKSSSAESSKNVASMGSAIQAIEAGTGSAFLQTDAAKKIKELVNDNEENMGGDREELMAFLQGEDTSEGSGEIVGMLKQMQEDMSKDLADATATEADAVQTYNELVKAKTKEFESLQAAIEEKMARLGELGVANAQMANDGGDTGDALEQDKKLLADLKANCANRQKEWDVEKKTRGEELLALADTIKMLNDDDALELFKKTLPGSAASFMQIQVTTAQMRSRALEGIHAAQKKHKKKMVKLDFVELAIMGKKVGFGQVIAMIDKMIGALKTEQAEDDDKKAYCNKEFDKADDEKKILERKVSDAETAIADAKSSVATLIDEIKETKAAIVELDGEVAIATMQRQAENAEFKKLMEENGAAMALIGMAKKRLNKFYNPKMALLQANSFAAQNMDSEETANYEAAVKANRGAQGVIQMLTTLEHDLDKEMVIAATEDKNAQKAYEQAMADAKEKRTADAKLLEDKEGAKSDADAAVQTNVDAKTAASKELQGTKDYIMTLHADCDWILQYYDTRKEARADEIDALGKAKDVLNGADYSFLQLSTKHRRLRR
jgi:hypothetical protein